MLTNLHQSQSIPNKGNTKRLDDDLDSLPLVHWVFILKFFLLEPSRSAPTKKWQCERGSIIRFCNGFNEDSFSFVENNAVVVVIIYYACSSRLLCK
jgi:hypothetical protein